jgi:hypothetical protein
MNQETIPDNNLPVYLQQYDVKIFDDKKESVGKVLYTTTGAIPSNKKEKRVWSLNLTGYLKPNVDTYHIVYDFSEVDYKYKRQISFENIVSGTFTICGKVLDASKIIGFDYSYSNIEPTLTIKLDTSKWDFRLKKESLFSYQLNVNDVSNCVYGTYNMLLLVDATATIVTNSCNNYFTIGIGNSYSYILLNPADNEDDSIYAYPYKISNGEATIEIWDDATKESSYLNFTQSNNYKQVYGIQVFTVSNIKTTSFDVLIEVPT